MNRTLAGPGNAEDPAVVRRQGPVRTSLTKSYAAELLLDEPVPDDFDSEEDDEVVDDDEDGDEVDGFAAAGALLDEEPRLSLR
jgi:hypothetical protein